MKAVKSRLQFFPLITLAAFLLPILVGLLGTWLPAFGYLPVVGAQEFSLTPFIQLFAHPSTWPSLKVTLVSGLVASGLAFFISQWLALSLYGSKTWQILIRSLSPLLAIPHAAFAIGFAFLISPSGWMIRLISPEVSGFESPPDWSTVKDPWGISLTLALCLKEIPFMLLMTLSALNRIDVDRTMILGKSLGYRQGTVWIKMIFPQIYGSLKLPLFAVLAYSLSVVDIAMIVGPSAPPTFALLVNRWFNDPDTLYRLVGAAGATTLFLLVAVSFLLVNGLEWLCKKAASDWIVNGNRASISHYFSGIAKGFNWVIISVTVFSLVTLVVWSFARAWRFPDSLPSKWSLKFWQKGWAQLTDPFWITVITGLVAICVAIVLVVGCLEYENRLKQKGIQANTHQILWLIYLPLLIPQIAFMFGVQVSLISLHAEGTWVALVWSHLMFVVPYVFLTLANIYRNYDQRFVLVAVGLNKSLWRSFLKVKLPMLLKPIAFAMATGFAVSVAQYLPTLYVGAGRFATITTETVNLASGSDRRIVAVFALWQFIVPLVMYALAILLPNWIFRHRKAMT
mgnify:CR=1 FL=1